MRSTTYEYTCTYIHIKDLCIYTYLKFKKRGSLTYERTLWPALAYWIACTHKYVWVMSYIHMNESCHRQWIGLLLQNELPAHIHVNEACHTYIWMSHVTHTYEWVMSQAMNCLWHDSFICMCSCEINCLNTYTSCHTYKWDTSHVWMSHATNTNVSRHTYEWAMSHICISHGTHTNESRPTYKWVMSHICISLMSHMWMTHVAHIKCVISHIWIRHVTRMK